MIPDDPQVGSGKFCAVLPYCGKRNIQRSELAPVETRLSRVVMHDGLFYRSIYGSHAIGSMKVARWTKCASVACCTVIDVEF
jgi:hypothetical protein